MECPFFVGGPVPPEKLVGRRKELDQLLSRLGRHGQSTVIVGEPRSGKTSLLTWLGSDLGQRELEARAGTPHVFTFIDAQMLEARFDQASFWQHALSPLLMPQEGLELSPRLAQALQTCCDNAFGNLVLERLFVRLKEAGLRLVLLLDEFDTLVQHPILHSAEFFGGLRALASRTGGLAIVAASRLPLIELERSTHALHMTGSPYFNFMTELEIGPLAAAGVDALLNEAGARFSAADLRFLREVSGDHPYLLQQAAVALWEAREEAPAGLEARRQTLDSLFLATEGMLNEIWRWWSPQTRGLCAAVALGQLRALRAASAGPAQAIASPHEFPMAGDPSPNPLPGAGRGLRKASSSLPAMQAVEKGAGLPHRTHRHAIAGNTERCDESPDDRPDAPPLTEGVEIGLGMQDQTCCHGAGESRAPLEMSLNDSRDAPPLTGEGSGERSPSLDVRGGRGPEQRAKVDEWFQPLVDFASHGAEMLRLEKRGVVARASHSPVGWRIRPSVFLAWIARKLLEAARALSKVERWWPSDGWWAPLTPDQRDQWLEEIQLAVGDLPTEGSALLRWAVEQGQSSLRARSHAAPPRVSCFVSYVSEDARHQEKLLVHLSPLVRQGRLSVWSREDLEAGADREQAVRERLLVSDLVVCLLSAEYLASARMDSDVTLALRQRAAGRTRMVPVVVRPCAWKDSVLSELEPLPRDGVPIVAWKDDDEAWTDVVLRLHTVLEARGHAGERS